MTEINTAAPVISPKSYYPALTGVRAIAALLVFFYHDVQHLNPANYPLVSKWGIRLLQQGHIGVPIFFVLSGLLIATRYAKSVNLSRPWLRRYFQNRFARIYPVYFLLSLLTFGAMLFHPIGVWYEWRPDMHWTQWDKIVSAFLNLTLTRAFFYDFRDTGVPLAWSLTVEETFYLLSPLLLLGLKRSMRNLFLYPFLLLGTGAALVAFCSRFLPYYGLMESKEFMLHLTFFGRCVEFLVGMGLAFVIARPALARPGMPATLWGCLGILLCVVALAVIENSLPMTSLSYLVSYRLVNNVLLPFPVAALFWGLVKERSLLRKLLESKLFDLLGKSSYALYLIHIGILDALIIKLVSGHVLVRLPIHLLLSMAIYKWIENPLHKILRAKPAPQPVPSGEVEVVR